MITTKESVLIVCGTKESSLEHPLLSEQIEMFGSLETVERFLVKFIPYNTGNNNSGCVICCIFHFPSYSMRSDFSSNFRICCVRKHPLPEDQGSAL